MGQILEVDSLFSPHMVLQRNKPIKIWGTVKGENPVKVSFMGNTVTAERKDQRWEAVLPPAEAARNQELLITCKEERICIRDVHVGEVWIAGGQSNMEFYMRYDQDFRQGKRPAFNDDIRFYDVPEICYEGQEQDFDYSRMGFWRRCVPEEMEYFSAVGYYFAEKLWEDLQVPVGIIGCNKGGSCTQTWMSREALKAHGQVWLDDYEREIASVNYPAYQEAMRKNPRMNMGDPFADSFAEETLYGIGAKRQRELMEQLASAMEGQPMLHYDNRPGCYYEYMLKKIAGVQARGVIWYQGESEVYHPECYYELFQDMIAFWRSLWQQELPFYCVQLAPFQNWMDSYGTDFPVIRRLQAEAVKQMNRAYLISSSDAGMRYDIHPKEKKPIGYRLGLAALKYEYGKKVQADAPAAAAVYTKNNDLYIDFSGDMETLEVRGEEIQELQLFAEGFEGEQEISFDAGDFNIEGTTLILRNADIGGRRVSRAAFAWKDYYKVNLYGSNGLPAMPFNCKVNR